MERKREIERMWFCVYVAYKYSAHSICVRIYICMDACIDLYMYA